MRDAKRVRSRPASGLALSVAVLLAITAALTSFSVVLEEGGWLLSALLTVAAVISAGAVARHRVQVWRPLWSLLAAAAAGVLSLQLQFAADTALLGVVPLAGTLERVTELIRAGEVSIAEQAVPAEADAGLRFLIAAGAGIIALLCDGVANASRRPALIALPLLGILAIPVIVAPGALPLASLLATATAYLAVLALHRPAANGGLAGARRAAVVGASVLIAALVVPPVLPPVVAGAMVPGGGIAGLSAGINPVLELGDDLRRPTAVTVLRYSTDQTTGLYLTLAHLDEFDGQTVQPVTGGESRALDDIGPPSWLGAGVERSEVSTRIELENVRTRWVPLPSAPVSLAGLAGEWLVADDGITVQSPEGVLREGVYTVRSLDAQPSAAQLEGAGVSATGLEAYRALPDLDATVEETAREVVDAADATSPYAQALALQRFFTGGEFAYSEDAPVEGGYDGSGADIVATFLDVRAGYCVHFASAMTLMARTLGIPARIAVGFQPGVASADAPGEYVVSSDDLHAWPELHFDGIGWVRFEPTPSRGESPGYADPTAPVEGVDAGQPEDAPAEDEQPAPVDEEQVDAGIADEPPAGIPDLIDGGDDGQGGAASPAGILVDARSLTLAALGLLALALIAPGVWRAARRARRRRSRDPVERWREVRDTARDLGLPAETTRTPRALAALWSAAVADLDASLAPLLEAVEKRAYTRQQGDDIEPPAFGEVLRRLRDSVPWWRRAAAIVLPLSLLDRAADGEGRPRSAVDGARA
ncbi:MAG: DUF3488 and transglutaminase-like domain-containing protein [Microcella sp.]|uniref:transglutaminase family protein n=1 Tax=Microcella sp. TaxID=1913979 RepID=UPI003316087B